MLKFHGVSGVQVILCQVSEIRGMKASLFPSRLSDSQSLHVVTIYYTVPPPLGKLLESSFPNSMNLLLAPSVLCLLPSPNHQLEWASLLPELHILWINDN